MSDINSIGVDREQDATRLTVSSVNTHKTTQNLFVHSGKCQFYDKQSWNNISYFISPEFMNYLILDVHTGSIKEC